MLSNMTDVRDQVLVGRITDLMEKAEQHTKRGRKMIEQGLTSEATSIFRQGGGQIRAARQLADQIADPELRQQITAPIEKLLAEVWNRLDLEENRPGARRGHLPFAPGATRGGWGLSGLGILPSGTLCWGLILLGAWFYFGRR